MQTVRLIHGGIALATALFIVYGSWVPFQFQRMGTDAALEQLRVILDEPWRWRGSRADWAINGLITLPLGFCSLGALLAGRRGVVEATVAALLVLLGSLCLSVTVELGQLWLQGRVTSLQDVAAQTIGAAGGIVGYLIGGRPFDGWAAEFVSQRGPEDRTRWVLQGYVVGLFGYSMLPLVAVMSMSELAYKYDSGQVEIIPFTYRGATFQDRVYGSFVTAILAVPVGMWGAMHHRDRRERPSPFCDAVFWAVGVLIAIEAAQLLIVTRHSSTTDVLLGTVGVVVGVAVMRRLSMCRSNGHGHGNSRVNGAVKWFVASVVYAAVLAVVSWAPYDFTEDRALINQRLEAFPSIPFSQMHGGSDINSLFSVIRLAVWFAPLGALAAMLVVRLTASRVGRQIGLVVAAATIAGWALLLELGQVLLPSRFADLTDVLVCVAWGWIALLVTARLVCLPTWAEQVSPDR